MSSIIDCAILHDGNTIPLLGIGCFALDKTTVYDSVSTALKTGYRLIDTASFYPNEVIGRALKDSGLRRDEFFITAKLDPSRHGFQQAKESLYDNLKKLSLEYVDLYFIHTPMPGRVLESWRGLMELKKEGKAKSIGVSNFNGDHIKALLDAGLEKPAVNQFELHPLHRQNKTVRFCRQHNIAVMGYCPLARGRIIADGQCPLLEELALKLKKSKAQICLRWALQQQFITIPKSTKSHHIIDNTDLYDFEISIEDMQRIEQLDDNMVVSIACTPMSMSWNEIKDNEKPGRFD